MIGVFNTIKINGTEVYRPNEFTLQREAVTAGEYTTCLGELRADLIGWKYADMELSFDMLPEAMMEPLLALSGIGAVDMIFTNEAGDEVTEQVFARASTAQVTRFTNDQGVVLWRDFALNITFVTTHPNEAD